MWTNKTLMSLGETPLIRDACDSVCGWISVSFCLASVDMDWIA
jgi:hypothetical protein